MAGLISIVPELRDSVFVNAQTTKWYPIKDAFLGDNLTEGTSAFNMYTFDGTNYNRVYGSVFGLRVDATRIQNMTIIGNKTPANNFANPTTAINSWDLSGLYNGTTWDMLQSSIHGDDLGTVSGGNVAAFRYVYDGANTDRIRSGGAALPGSVLVNKSSTASSNITTNTSTVVKATPGFLNMITVNAVGNTSTAAIYDDSTSPCNTGLVETFPTDVVFAVKIEHQYANGICVLTAGVAAANISVLYR